MQSKNNTKTSKKKANHKGSGGTSRPKGSKTTNSKSTKRTKPLNQSTTTPANDNVIISKKQHKGKNGKSASNNKDKKGNKKSKKNNSKKSNKRELKIPKVLTTIDSASPRTNSKFEARRSFNLTKYGSQSSIDLSDLHNENDDIDVANNEKHKNKNRNRVPQTPTMIRNKENHRFEFSNSGVNNKRSNNTNMNSNNNNRKNNGYSENRRSKYTSGNKRRNKRNNRYNIVDNINNTFQNIGKSNRNLWAISEDFKENNNNNNSNLSAIPSGSSKTTTIRKSPVPRFIGGHPRKRSSMPEIDNMPLFSIERMSNDDSDDTDDDTSSENESESESESSSSFDLYSDESNDSLVIKSRKTLNNLKQTKKDVSRYSKNRNTSRNGNNGKRKTIGNAGKNSKQNSKTSKKNARHTVQVVPLKTGPKNGMVRKNKKNSKTNSNNNNNVNKKSKGKGNNKNKGKNSKNKNSNNNDNRNKNKNKNNKRESKNKIKRKNEKNMNRGKENNESKGVEKKGTNKNRNRNKNKNISKHHQRRSSMPHVSTLSELKLFGNDSKFPNTNEYDSEFGSVSSSSSGFNESDISDLSIADTTHSVHYSKNLSAILRPETPKPRSKKSKKILFGNHNHNRNKNKKNKKSKKTSRVFHDIDINFAGTKQAQEKSRSSQLGKREKQDVSTIKTNKKSSKRKLFQIKKMKSRRERNKDKEKRNNNFGFGGIVIHIGHRYRLDDGRIGVCRFKGRTMFGKATEDYIGIVLEIGEGKHNGTVKGRVYFKCRDGKGVLVRPHRIVQDLGNPFGKVLTQALIDDPKGRELMNQANSAKIAAKTMRMLLLEKQKESKEDEDDNDNDDKNKTSNTWTPSNYDIEDHSTTSFLAQKLHYNKRLLDKHKHKKAKKKKRHHEI